MIGEGIPFPLIIILAIIAFGATLFVAATLFYFNELEKTANSGPPEYPEQWASGRRVRENTGGTSGGANR